MVLRFDPFEHMDRSLEERHARRQGMMALDAYRRGQAVIIHLDLPGVSRGAIEITNEHDHLTIRASRRYAEEEGDRILAQERAQGDFQRQIVLSSLLDADRMTAELDDGVLSLRIPVSETAQPKRIAIESSDRRQ